MNSQENDGKQFLQSTVNAISTMLELPVSIWLVDEKANVLRATAVSELLEEKIGNAEIPLNIPNIGVEVFRSQQIKLIESIEAEKNWRFKSEILSLGLKSAIVAPLPIKTRMVGVLVVYDPENKSKELEKLKPKVESSADQITATLRHIRGLETLNEVAQLINSEIQQSPDLFKHILKSAEKVLDCKHVSIFLVDTISGNLELKNSSSLDVKRKFFEPGQGLVSEVVKSGKSLLVSDIRKHSGFVKGLTTDIEERSMLLSPIKLREQIIGVISADYHGLNGFDNHDQVLLEALTKQTATALHNTDLYQKERDKAQALTKLYEISQDSLSIETLPDIRKLLEKLAVISKKVLKADMIELYEYNSTHNEFKLPQITAGDKYDPSILKKEIFEDDTVSKFINRTKPLFTENAQKEFVFSEDYAVIRKDQPKERFVIREAIQSNAVIPLKTGFESVGLMFANYRTPQKFTKEQRELIVLFADQAAMVIKNAQMYHYVNQRRKALVEVGKEITAGIQLNESDVLELIYEQVSNVLGMENISIALYDETTDKVRFVLASTEGVRRNVENEAGWESRIAGQGKTETIVQTKKHLLLSTRKEVEQAGFTPTPGHKDYDGKIASSWLGVPMIVGDKVLGVLANYDYGKDYFYNDDDIEILQALADLTAIAIDNSRLAHQLILTNNSQAALIELGQKLTSNIQLNESDILQLIYDNASKLMDTDNIYIALYDEPTKSVRFEIVYEDGKQINVENSAHWKPRKVDEGGRTEWIIRENKPLLFKTKSEAEAWYNQPGRTKHLGTVIDPSWMGVPMIIANKVLGVIGIHHTMKEYVYNKDDVNILLSMANQAAIAIENARLYKQLQKQRQRETQIEAIGEISASIAAPLECNRVLKGILDWMIKLMGEASLGEIRLIDSKTNDLVAEQSIGESINKKFNRIQVGKGITGWVAQHKKPLLVPDVSKDKRYLPFIEGTRSEIAVPIKKDDKVIGVLNIEHPKVNAFTEHDVTLAVAIGNLTAVAIENAKLYDRLETEVKECSAEIDAAYKISESAHNVSNLNQLYPEIHNIIRKLMAAENFYIVIQDPVTHNFDIPYSRDEKGEELNINILMEKGMAGYVYKEKKSLIGSPEIRADLGIDVIGIPSKSWLGAPLIKDDKCIGVIVVQSYDKELVYEKDEQDILDFVSQQIAMAIELVRAQENFEKRTAQLNVAYRISEAAHNVSMLKEFWQSVHKIIKELMFAENFRIVAFNPDGKISEFLYFDERDNDSDSQKQIIEKGMTGYVFKTRKSLLIAKPEDHLQLVKEGKIESVGTSSKSWLGVPLNIHDKAIGVLTLHSYDEKGVYGESEKNTLEFISEQIAITIERVRMQDELKKYRANLIDLTQKLTSSIQLKEDEILQLIYENASELMDTDNMYIALYDDPTDAVRFGLVHKEGREINTKEGEEEEGYKPRSGGQGKTEYIIKTKESIFHPTLLESEAWYEKPGHLAYDRIILPSWVGVPMITGEKVFGVVATYNPTQEHVYSKDDLEILQAMASLAAIALDNARLYENLEGLVKERTERLEEKINELELANQKIIEKENIIDKTAFEADFVHNLKSLVGTIPIRANYLKEKIENMTNSIQDDIKEFTFRLHNMAEMITTRTNHLKEENEMSTDSILYDINKLLTEADQLRKPPQKDKIDINSMLRAISDKFNIQYRNEIKKGQLEIKEEIEAGLHNVWGLYLSLSDAILNIVSNGIESVLEVQSGKVTVKANNYTDDANSEWVKIEIADNGKGISEEIKDKLFSAPFISTKGENRGYGLWRASIIIKNINGNIEFISRYGEGTIFTILLPKAKDNNL